MAAISSAEKQQELIDIANSIVADGKGILASDEGIPVIGARLAGINVELKVFQNSSAELFLRKKPSRRKTLMEIAFASRFSTLESKSESKLILAGC
ncbi:unnamed protein product [Oikopleura dioica]|uniref:fructose-bisphosphate aldolase n=1 Tax=Oikopleura dioica TaxID=34765 RepID=E4X691_OIKDI|nr:unnamed protein product [Oikopleura dioica]